MGGVITAVPSASVGPFYLGEKFAPGAAPDVVTAAEPRVSDD